MAHPTPPEAFKFIPSHDIALWTIEGIDRVCSAIGFSPSSMTREVIYGVLVVAVALGAGWLVSKLVVAILRALLRLGKSPLAKEALKERIMTKWARIIPPLLMIALLPWAFQRGTLATVLMRLMICYLIVVTTVAVNGLITMAWTRYNDRQNTKNLPLKGILNSFHGIVWIVAVIIIVSIVIDRSPVVLLTGLGAFAAALMLVFKDSILGFVAGIQLSQNDMVRMGDWIEVPGTPANGNVMDMTLSTVKVRNFDNTVVTLPPYTLVSQSFKNWRGMMEMQSRRVDFSLVFDFFSVRLLEPAERERLLKEFPLLGDFVAKASQVDTPEGRLYIDPANRVNGAMETNLGLFRAYVCAYVMSNSQFDHVGDLLVYTLDPTPQGVPLRVYCFSVDYHWTAFEAVQSALTEHLVATAPAFGLSLHNDVTNSSLHPLHTAAAASPTAQSGASTPAAGTPA